MKMHGISFADGVTVVNADVHKDNVKAFEQAGWKHGSDPDAPDASEHDGKIEAKKPKAKEAEEPEAKGKGKAK